MLLPGQAQTLKGSLSRHPPVSNLGGTTVLNPNGETKFAGVAVQPLDGPKFWRNLLDVKDLTSQGLSAAEDCQLTASLLTLNFGKPKYNTLGLPLYLAPASLLMLNFGTPSSRIQ